MPNHIEVLNLLVPSLVTIIGFVITYFANKNAFISEIYKSKNISSSEKLQEYFLPLLEIIQNKFTNFSEEEKAIKLNEIFNAVLIYGSEELVRIATEFKVLSYKTNGNPDVNEIFACVGLLITQYKYEITGQYISSDTWFKYTITDYEVLKPRISSLINEKIDKLKLNHELKCID